MNQVWLFLKVLQLICGTACLAFHIKGSLHFPEPLPHCLIFCATYAGFMLLAIIRCIRLVTGQPTLLHPEMFVSISGSLMHYICGMLSMHYAENDFHLIYMGAQEELEHVFFFYCKTQSLSCIVTGSLYLLQMILLLDMIVKSEPNADLKPVRVVTEPPVWDNSYKTMSNKELDYLASTTADVYFLGKAVDHWLRVKSKWFRQLAGGQHLEAIIKPRIALKIKLNLIEPSQASEIENQVEERTKITVYDEYDEDDEDQDDEEEPDGESNNDDMQQQMSYRR